MESVLPRVANLEDINAIERCKLQLSKVVDEIVNENRSVGDIKPFAIDDYSWSCSQFVNAKGIDEYKRFLENCRKRVSFALTFVTGGIIDVNTKRTQAQGKWSVWQPFSMGEAAWVLVGRSYDTFVRRGGEWKVQTTKWDVAVLAPWVEDWGSVRISPSWKWE